MTKEQFLILLGNIDDDIIIEAKASTEISAVSSPESTTTSRLTRKKGTINKRKLTRLIAIVAAALLIVGTAIATPVLLYGLPHNPPNTTDRISTISGGASISGKQEIVFGNTTNDSIGDADMIAPGFEIQTVIEAEVVEVLPDTYFYAASYSLPLHVAKLRVVDRIRGDGVPAEIFLCYPYYDTSVFDGYDRFIMSLEQTGTENYMLVNGTQSRVDYFSNMFEITLTRDLGYGSVIAFNNDRVDESFWDNTDHLVSKVNIGKDYFDSLLSSPDAHKYPAAKNSTLSKVRANIISLAADEDNYHIRDRGCDYVTLDDIFATDESRSLRTYLEPTDKSVFSQEIIVNTDRVIAFYTRVINGFLTNEEIIIGGYDGDAGNVSRRGESFTPHDLEAVPDIASALSELDLSALSPPHITLTDELSFAYCKASGVYRKIDGQVYGVIGVIWNYRQNQITNAIRKDDLYYLYNQNGEGEILERDELRAVLGNDPFIQIFPYDSTMAWD